MKTPWHTLSKPAPPATVYGLVIDHIWANQEINAARRPHWPDDMFVNVQPCVDLDEETEENGNIGAMKAWVFFDNGLEYNPPDADLLATDWLIGAFEPPEDEVAECPT